MSRAGTEGHFSINSLQNGLMKETRRAEKKSRPVQCGAAPLGASATHAASSSRILLQSLNAPALPTDSNGLADCMRRCKCAAPNGTVHPSSHVPPTALLRNGL